MGNTVGHLIDELQKYDRKLEVTNMDGEPIFEVTKDTDPDTGEEYVALEFEE
jgi:hypothetical protein